MPPFHSRYLTASAVTAQWSLNASRELPIEEWQMRGQVKKRKRQEMHRERKNFHRRERRGEGAERRLNTKAPRHKGQREKGGDILSPSRKERQGHKPTPFCLALSLAPSLALSAPCSNSLMKKTGISLFLMTTHIPGL